MLNEFKERLERLGLSKKEPVALAISGGSDSMALAYLCKQAGLKFTAIIVDHKLRKESSKEAAEVKAYLKNKLKINAEILTNKKPIPKANIEEFLRIVRHELIFDYCKKNKIKKVLTAHHMDDQIETFLMRLERGSGLDGLTGIKEITKYKPQATGYEVQVIHALLSYTKNDLKNILVKNKIKWWEDKTNKDTKHTRNNIRATLEGFSDYDLMRKRLGGVIDNLSRAKDFIEQEKIKAAKRLIIPSKKGLAVIDITKYKNLHDEIRLRILRDMVKKYSRTQKDVRMDSIKNLDKSFFDKNFKSASLHGIKMLKKGLNLVSFVIY